jgi:hypothetical protein
MTSYHRKHETTPVDKNAGAKLLTLEKKVHQQKKLGKEKTHLPGQKKNAGKK